MKDSDIPVRFGVAFGANADPSNITYPIPVTPPGGGRASLQIGMDPANFQPVQSGGIPPFGKDQNGFNNMVSRWAQWQAAGAPCFYDSTFSTAIGGYPKGAVLQSVSTFGKSYLCLADDNTVDPDSASTNWRTFYVQNAYPPAGTILKLAGSGAAGGKLASWTVSQIIAAETVGGRSYEGVGLTLSFNGATVGNGGMDTGAMPTAGDFLIYAIYNPTTNAWDTLGTTSSASTAPSVYAGSNMPAGFTASALIWVGRTATASTNFVAFKQQDRRVAIPPATLIAGQNSVPYTTTATTSIVPAAGRMLGGSLSLGGTGTVFAADDVSGVGERALATSGAAIGSPLPDVSCAGGALAWRTNNNPTLTLAVSYYIF